MRMRGLSLLLVAALGCGDDPTQIIVEVYGADEIVRDVTGVRIRVEGRGRDDGDFSDPPVYVTDNAVPAGESNFPLTHVIAPLDGDANRIYRVTAQGLISDATGISVISEARAISGFIKGETRVLRLYLPGGPCRDRTCPVTQTCLQGSCVDIVEIPPELLPGRNGDPFDAGVMDVGLDTMGDTCEGEGDPCDPEALCETGVTMCSDGEPVCVGTGTPRAAATVCRASDGVCDAEETCDGESLECPVDAPVADLTPCGDEGEICVAGVCGDCDPSAACDTGNACERGALVCDTEPRCDAVGPADPGTLCRAATGLCDQEEFCDGMSMACPDDALHDSGFVCRDAAGPCDIADVCDGSSVNCADELADSTVECNASQGGCDPAEVCDGVSVECPSDVLLGMGALCRGAVNECDIDESCDGTTPTCPADELVAFGGSCGADGSFICNGSGDCISPTCGMECNTGRPCEIGIVDCQPGMAPTCIPNGVRDTSTVCRLSSGVCDVAESCDGSNPECPADGFASAATECRAAVGVCDVAEMCTGTGAACPSDSVAPSSQVCRTTNGDCDVAERCDGTTKACPEDLFDDGRVCRPATGLCDVPEACDGRSSACPADVLRLDGAVCRAVGGVCDVAEVCDGADPQCPPNLFDSGSLCRGAVDDCDVDEFCSGSAATCPTDQFEPAGFVCLEASGFECEADAVCSGTDPFCPIGFGTCDDLVISEVLPEDAFTAGRQGFVEVYNTSDAPLLLEECLLLTSAGGVTALDSGGIEGEGVIPPHGFFLVSYGSASSMADIVTNQPHPANFGGEVVLDCEGAAVDACAWDPSTAMDGGMDGGMSLDGGDVEDAGIGDALEGPPAISPPRGASIERKACFDSDEASMLPGGRDETSGNSEDTDINEDDFFVRMTPQPQSSSNAPETPSICP